MPAEVTVVMRLRREEDETVLTTILERALEDLDCIVLDIEQEEV
jgi:hypothetical protein